MAVSASAMTAEDQLRFADGLYVREMHDMAVREYLVLVRDFPQFDKLDTVLFRIAECYRRLGERAGAERFYRRVMTEFPTSPYRFRAELRRAELFADGGQRADAVSLFRALLAANPPEDIRAPAQFYLGQSLEEMGAAADAQDAFRAVIRDAPGSPFVSYACLALADSYRRAGDRDAERRELYRLAIENPAGDRVAAEALFQLGELAFGAADYPAASDAYKKLLERFPADERSREAKLRAAWSWLHVGRQEEALALANTSVGPDAPDAEEWLYLKANALRRLSRRDEARVAYEDLLARHPRGRTASSAAYEKALLAFQVRDYAQAVRDASAAPAEGDIEEDVYWLLAESHAGLGEPAKALEYYARIAEKFPDSPRAPQALFETGRLKQDASSWVEASDAYRRLAKKHPEHALAPAALHASGVCRTRAEQRDEALKDWALLAKQYPGYEKADEVLYQKAVAEMQGGKAKAAMATLDGLLEKHPDSGVAAEARYARGMLRDEAGQWADAEREFRGAIAKEPAAKLRQAAEYRLALVLQKQGNADESARLIQSLIGGPLRAEMPPALLEWLARYQLERKAFPEAAAAADALAEADGADWRQIGGYLAGVARMGAGDSGAARDALARALAEDARTPDAARAALSLADLELAAGRHDDARAAYEKAASLAESPDLIAVRARSYYGLGRAAEAQGALDAAARYYLGVAVLFDDAELSAESLARAADVFGRLDRPAEREQAMKELKQRYPDSRWMDGTGTVSDEHSATGMEHQVTQ